MAKNEAIERVVLAIHSSSYDAKAYYDNATKAMQMANADNHKCLIIAPHFLSEEILNLLSPEAQGKKDYLRWELRPFWGTSRGIYNGKSVLISAYDVIDQILSHVVVSGNFPNLKTVIILGHSAGGQLVNRYAAGNDFETTIARPRNIAVKYLVMAPSSYVYFTPERFVRTPNSHFEIPVNPPAGFNNWGYGMENLFVYHKNRRITPEMMQKNYAAKTILYLVGQKDKDPDDKSIGRSEAAMLQGRHRLERGRIYFDYLVHLFGPEIKNTQRFVAVPDVGHSGRGLMCSVTARLFIFGNINPAGEKDFPSDSENKNYWDKKTLGIDKIPDKDENLLQTN
ncbi:MAG: hypothetical protein ABFD91_14125 [Anaerohalosphaeraceae bacterium]